MERLKSLRTLYHATVFASCAVLVFALIPNRAKQYRAALRELGVLERIKLANYPAYIKSRLKKQNKANYEFLLRVARRDGLRVSGHPRYTYTFLCDSPPPQSGLNLVGYDAFLEGTRKAAAIVVDPNERLVERRLRSAIANIKPLPSLVGIDIESPVNDMMVWPSNARVWEWGQLGNNATDVTDVRFYLSNLSGRPPNIPPIPVTFRLGPIETGQLALDWLRSIPGGQHLFGGDSGTFLPHLKMFWGRVGTMTPDSATLFLEQRIESTKTGSLSLFGIPVERSLVIWVGPALCLSFLIFFVLHLEHLLSIGQKKPAEIRKAAEYPWIISFPGLMSATIGYATLFLLPAAADALLLLSHGQLRELSTRVGLVATTLAIVVSICGVVLVHRFRLLIQKSGRSAGGA